MSAFDLLEEWPVSWAAAIVVQPDGSSVSVGPTARVTRIASVTKPLVALAVLVAMEEGIIELDEPLGPPGSTPRHLLSHAGGLDPEKRRLLTEPGTRRIYSNAGFELLAEVVASRSEMAFADYLAEAVFEPLGLERTELVGSAAHGVESNADDLALVVHELLRPDPQLIAHQTRLQMTSPVFAEIPGVLPGFGLHVPNPWGLGVELRGHKRPHWTGTRNSPATFGHFGRSGGLLWVDPVAAVGCVVLTDRDFGPWSAALWPEFCDLVLAQKA